MAERPAPYWTAATWSIPVGFPVILGSVILLIALFDTIWPDSATWLPVGVAATIAGSLTCAIAFVMARRPSPLLRGIALGVVCVTAVVALGLALYTWGEE